MPVPIPQRMKHLGVDHRGYAKFFLAHRDANGDAHFIVNDERKTYRCASEDLCSLCGSKLFRGRWFVGGPLSAFCDNGAYFDPPMHHECMRYAVQVCPWLAAKTYARKLSIEQIAAQVGTALEDKTVMPGRPTVFVCIHARSSRYYQGPTALQFKAARPYIAIEFWRMGFQLTEKEGRKIADKAVLEFAS